MKKFHIRIRLKDLKCYVADLACSNMLSSCMNSNGLAMVCTDLGIITAVSGGSLATIICIIFPAMMYRKAIANLGDQAQKREEREGSIALVLMVVGILIGSVGVRESLI